MIRSRLNLPVGSVRVIGIGLAVWVGLWAYTLTDSMGGSSALRIGADRVSAGAVMGSVAGTFLRIILGHSDEQASFTGGTGVRLI